MAITVQQLFEYMGIDETDSQVNANALRAVTTANAYMVAAIGEDYDAEDPKAVEIALMVAGDLYDTRGTQDKANANIRRLYMDLCDQLRMERRRSRAEGDQHDDL